MTFNPSHKLYSLGIILQLTTLTQAQPPAFTLNNPGIKLPCASSCFASATSNWSSICATNPTPTSSILWSALPSCLSTACPQSDYSSLLITDFPNSYGYGYGYGYPTSICEAWSSESTGSSSLSEWTVSGGSWTSTFVRSGLTTTMTTATTGTGTDTGEAATSTDDSAEVLVTSVISGSVIVATATNAASGPSPLFIPRSPSLDSMGGFIGFLVGMLAFL